MQRKGKLITEGRLSKSRQIDKLKSIDILKLMNDEDKTVPLSVEKVLPQVAKAVELVISAFSKGGRLFYIGAGTSGRLGICDSAECPPTFGVEPGIVEAILAGGPKAMFKAKEGAEDKEEEAVRELKKRKFSKKDVLIGLSASGRTPFVVGGLKYAGSIGAATVSVTCNIDSQVSKYARVPIAVVVGPEVITGSTRLKAGTAEKLILNMISTASMIKSGRTFGNYMVDLLPLSNKLKVRTLRILKELTGLKEKECEKLLKQSKGNLKAAVLMGIKRVTYNQALDILKKTNRNLRLALEKK